MAGRPAGRPSPRRRRAALAGVRPRCASLRRVARPHRTIDAGGSAGRAAGRCRGRPEDARPKPYIVRGPNTGPMKAGLGPGQRAASRPRGRPPSTLQPATGAPAAATVSTPFRLDMRIRDFGPIKKGAISLRPLTIFIGPSNTGKSYAAMLAHSIIASSSSAARRPFAPAGIPDQSGALAKLSRDMLGMLLALAPEETRKCPPAMASSISRLCRHALSARLKSEIEVNFASPVQDVIRHGASRFSVTLASNGRQVMAYGGGRLTLRSAPKIDVAFQLTKAGNGAEHLKVTDRDDGTIHCRVDRDLIASEAGPGVTERLYRLIEEKALPRMVPGLPASSVYFPAARTGILQAHRAISSAIVRGAPCGGAEGSQAPRLSGVVSDFVSAMIDMCPVRGPYFDIGSQMESDLFGGHIGLKHSDHHAFPEMVYRNHGGDVPVRRASSTISELAPLTLHLKHRAVRGGMLVVEEPEAHLHPDSQLRLAGHVVRMVRNGVNVLITTHGDTLFEAIGQYMEVGAMPPESRRRALGTDELYLREDEVAPHLFAPGRDGSTAKKIRVSAKDGISQDEFIRVAETLCENNARIEEYLG